MMTFDELAFLENHFIEEQKKGRKMSDLYESVQHAGNIIPRLYLLITVGSAYIRTKEAPVKLILKDLLDMVKGVQQPIRGLFLRYYLLKMMKDKLPDEGSEFEGAENGNIQDAIDFILQNMSEMNRLWVRLQHLSSQKDKEMREVERNELRMTVGENIIRLSSLEGLTFDIYKDTVLPKILEIVVICKDTLAQQYLMECIIQAFPDEYHLQTLEQLLETTATLNPNVDIKSIFINLMEKLSKFAAGPQKKELSPEEEQAVQLGSKVNIFKLFKKYTDKIIEEQGKTIDVSRLLELEVAFMNFSIKTYPANIQYVNEILESCNQILKTTPINNNDKNCMKLMVRLLSIPLDSHSIAVLGMGEYLTLMQYMKFQNKRTVAIKIVKTIIKDQRVVSRPTTVDQLIEFIMPLLQDDKDMAKEDTYEFEDGQNSVAKLTHLITSQNSDLWYTLLLKLKKVFIKGGQNRQKFTLPALLFSFLRLSYHLEAVGAGPSYSQDPEENQIQLMKVDQVKLFKSVNEIILTLQESQAELCLKLYLQGCQAINQINNNAQLEDMAYEFASQAMLIYQEEVSDADKKLDAIKLISSTLFHLGCFSEENQSTLLANALSSCA
jgi:vacuolar protein sorting-associated protein 35